MTWQNPGLAQFLRDHDAGPGAARRSKQRQRELVIANYLQRYCLKNDTIGFFGPVGWASVDSGAAGLVVTPADRLIARRSTYFEVWAIDKVADAIARQGRERGWLRPRRTRSVFLAGSVLHRPHRQPVTLTGAELGVLLACDGRRTIGEVLDEAGYPQARAVLARLAELGAVRLDLEGPADAWPERLLRDKLELIADPVARAAALAPLEELVRARDAVAATAEDPVGLQQALAALAATFEQITGSPATRRAGENYAGRTLVYQDTVRDVRVELGDGGDRGAGGAARPGAGQRPLAGQRHHRPVPRTLRGAGGPRERPARWRRPCRCNGCSPWPRLTWTPTAARGQVSWPASVAELQRRWAQVLGPPQSPHRHQVSSAEISARAAECFPRRPVAWSGARQHSPDIMLAAASADEVERGNFLLVLGEIHLATNTLDGRLWVEQHPDPDRLVAAEQADRGPERIVPIRAKDHPDLTSRLSPPSALMGPGQLYWSAAIADSSTPRKRTPCCQAPR